jgi:hypothetical protein
MSKFRKEMLKLTRTVLKVLLGYFEMESVTGYGSKPRSKKITHMQENLNVFDFLNLPPRKSTLYLPNKLKF